MHNYLTYPMKVMNITQNYLGKTSHYPHTTGKPKDYPTDNAGADGGRDWFYCNCDEVVIKRIYGVGSGGTNTMWLESTSKVKFADGGVDYATQMLIHPNDSDLKRLKVGQKFKRGDKICQEGTDGATGNHIHLAVGKGKMTGSGWTKNSSGKWVLTTADGAIKPEDAFYIDPEFTKVVDTKGLHFKYLPQGKPKAGKYKVTCDALNIRKGTTKGAHIVDVITKGTVIEISKTKVGWNDEYWGKIIGKGWVDMTYLKSTK